ncbi:MAG TPA: dihydrodipicolinate synthase family protein [Gemmatimonadaceae bacterium]|nr:dihydrodipicolinate synthase family protein [Gemmatimonadaceae bacterium]
MSTIVAAKGPPAGLFAPLVTTFRGGDTLDLDAFAANLRAHLAAGVDGVVVAGSTGEAALLEEDERTRLLAMARPVVPDERWLIAGTGAESTRGTVRRCRAAAEQGADAVLVVAPHYYGQVMTLAALRAHYRRVADESPLPVLLYNIPKYMHFALPPELVAELARHENVIGIKDSSGDLALFGEYRAAQSETFSLLTGNTGIVHEALRLGARGGILAVSLFAPEVTLRIFEAWRAGDVEGSAAAQATLAPLGVEIVGRMGVAGIKAALDLVGLRGGALRSPLQPLDETGVARVAELLAAAGVTADVAAA